MGLTKLVPDKLLEYTPSMGLTKLVPDKLLEYTPSMGLTKLVPDKLLEYTPSMGLTKLVPDKLLEYTPSMGLTKLVPDKLLEYTPSMGLTKLVPDKLLEYTPSMGLTTRLIFMEPMLTIALKAARKAGEIIEHAYERVDLITIEEKGRNDFVSDVDRKAEKEVIYHLRKSYPDHKFLGEESGASGAEESDYEWIIDPLDGTTNFLHGIPQFSVSVACKFRGQLEHAVVLNPVTREEFTASRGKGAMLNGRRLRVSQRRNLDGALIGTGIPFNGYALEHIDSYLSCMREVASQTAGLRRPGSAALDLAYVAAGRFDGFWEMNLKAWDMAAGILLVKESGGLLADFKGDNNYMDSGNIVCGTPKVFKPLLQIVAKHMGDI